MRTIDFLKYRVAFSGLPFGELEEALSRVHEGGAWERSFQKAARGLRQMALQRQVAGFRSSAAQAWLWAAAAYQAASLGMHLDPEGSGWQKRIQRLRHMAKSAYAHGLLLDRSLGRPVVIATRAGEVHGYVRWPSARVRGTIVLLNGLDSICEVELHRFGEAFLRRGFAVLALAIPDTSGAGNGEMGFRAEYAAPALADWIERHRVLGHGPLGAFGVSFGGHLAMRVLAGEPRFRAGAAVSPAAWLDRRQLGLRRVRQMFSLAFGTGEGPKLDQLAAEIRLSDLPAPRGCLLVLDMEGDELFGPQHCATICDWGAGRVEVRRLAAEHVGTSRVHCWLPEVCDWFQNELSTIGKED